VELVECLVSQQARGGRWEVLKPAAMVSAGGTTLTSQPDGAILASGKNPSPETYTITFKTNLTGMLGVRLELLTDPSLPSSGPGRAGNGNILLSEFRITAAPLGGSSKARAVALQNAWADFSQGGYPISGAIDGNPATAWAVVPKTGQPHVALFQLKEPITHT